MDLKPKDTKSRELDSSFINADGVKRNLLKFYWELVWLWSQARDARQRFYRKPWNGHSFINLIVESLRCAPYTLGHIIGIGLAAVVLVKAIFYFSGLA